MSLLHDELQAENRRLARELAGLRTRLQAIEDSRWHRLNPRRLWQGYLRSKGASPEQHAPNDATAASQRPFQNPRTARFRDEVLARGVFTQNWAIGDVPAWEPILKTLEGRPTNLLEIGSFEGLAACYLLWRLPDAVITCVDTFAGSGEHHSTDVDVSSLEARFDANVALVDATRVRKLVGDSKRRLLDLTAEQARFDLVYVDGSHLGLDVIVDASLAWRVLNPGGVLVFDDYPWAELGEDPLLRPGPAIEAFLATEDDRFISAGP